MIIGYAFWAFLNFVKCFVILIFLDFLEAAPFVCYGVYIPLLSNIFFHQMYFMVTILQDPIDNIIVCLQLMSWLKSG